MNAIQDDFLLNEFLESFIVSLFVGEYREKKKSFSRFLNFFSDTHWRDLMCWIGFFQIGDLGVTRPLQRQHRLQTLPQYNRETLPSWRVAAPCARNTGWVLSLVDIISHALRQSRRRWLVSSFSPTLGVFIPTFSLDCSDLTWRKLECFHPPEVDSFENLDHGVGSNLGITNEPQWTT